MLLVGALNSSLERNLLGEVLLFIELGFCIRRKAIVARVVGFYVS